MCRFLIAKFESPTNSGKILKEFSLMAKNSQAFDGDWQGDGWGVSWIDEIGSWQTRKSLLPIWEGEKLFASFPKTSFLAVHARSASFPDQKDIIEYNQPFVEEPYLFVFNGLLKKVALSSLPGRIGSQKIWFLLKKLLKRLEPKEALLKIKTVLLENTENIQALNIGLCDKGKIYSLCYFSKYPDYYQLRHFQNSDVKIVCAGELRGYGEFKPLIVNEVSEL